MSELNDFVFAGSRDACDSLDDRRHRDITGKRSQFDEHS